MNSTARAIACWLVLAFPFYVSGSNATDTAEPADEVGSGDRPTPAQDALIQGAAETKYAAAIEKADNEHQATMKKCEGLVWEEEKLCKDQVSTETAQAQANAAKKLSKQVPPSQ